MIWSVTGLVIWYDLVSMRMVYGASKGFETGRKNEAMAGENFLCAILYQPFFSCQYWAVGCFILSLRGGLTGAG